MHRLQREYKWIQVLTTECHSHEAAESEDTCCMKNDPLKDTFHYIAASEVLEELQESVESMVSVVSREPGGQRRTLTWTLWNIS